jgi:hypothetical protein
MLPRAKVPIIKLTINSSQASPMRMQCDIGFENRLALENTRLLYTYALVDSRLRTIVLFSARGSPLAIGMLTPVQSRSGRNGERSTTRTWAP